MRKTSAIKTSESSLVQIHQYDCGGVVGTVSVPAPAHTCTQNPAIDLAPNEH